MYYIICILIILFIYYFIIIFNLLNSHLAVCLHFSPNFLQKSAKTIIKAPGIITSNQNMIHLILHVFCMVTITFFKASLFVLHSRKVLRVQNDIFNCIQVLKSVSEAAQVLRTNFPSSQMHTCNSSRLICDEVYNKTANL